VQDTVGEVIVAIPKPRGEGTWAFIRFYLLKAWHRNKPLMCCVPSCPNPAHQVRQSNGYMGWRERCEFHDQPDFLVPIYGRAIGYKDELSEAEEREHRATRLAAMREERERKIASGEWPAPGHRTFWQWLGISGY